MPKKKQRPPQHPERYQAESYESFNLWLDYWLQFELITATQPGSVLEVGKGLGTLEFLLKRQGIAYTSVDVEKTLKPDIVADVTAIPVDDKSVDVVCAFQVLEHIPFSEFEVALSELGRIARQRVIISLPYSTIYFSFAFSFFYTRYLEWLFSFLGMKPMYPKYFNIKVPTFFLDTFGMIPEHAWEMGRKNYPKSKIEAAIESAGFEILEQRDRMFYPYHHFFILQPPA